MSARIRKLIGGIGLMVFLAGYVWAATAISDRLPDDNMPLKLVFFAVAGIGWGVPILPLLSWMNRAD